MREGVFPVILEWLFLELIRHALVQSLGSPIKCVIIFDANPKNIHCFLPVRTEIRGHFIEGEGLGGSNEFGTQSQNCSLTNRSCQLVSKQTRSYTNTG